MVELEVKFDPEPKNVFEAVCKGLSLGSKTVDDLLEYLPFKSSKSRRAVCNEMERLKQVFWIKRHIKYDKKTGEAKLSNRFKGIPWLVLKFMIEDLHRLYKNKSNKKFDPHTPKKEVIPDYDSVTTLDELDKYMSDFMGG